VWIQKLCQFFPRMWHVWKVLSTMTILQWKTKYFYWPKSITLQRKQDTFSFHIWNGNSSFYCLHPLTKKANRLSSFNISCIIIFPLSKAQALDFFLICFPTIPIILYTIPWGIEGQQMNKKFKCLWSKVNNPGYGDQRKCKNLKKESPGN